MQVLITHHIVAKKFNLLYDFNKLCMDEAELALKLRLTCSPTIHTQILVFPTVFLL